MRLLGYVASAACALLDALPWSRQRRHEAWMAGYRDGLHDSQDVARRHPERS